MHLNFLRSASIIALLLGLMNAASACKPIFRPYIGFVHAPESYTQEHERRPLPSNARGALFIHDENLWSHCISGDIGIVCDHLPESLHGQSFRIEDLRTRQRLQASLQRVDFDQHDFSAPVGRKFISIVPRLTKCITRQDERLCAQLGVKLGEQEHFIKSLLNKGYIYEATDKFDERYKASHGYFLVAPRGGIRAGASYSISYASADLNTYYPLQIELDIDGSPLEAATDGLQIVSQGDAKRAFEGRNPCYGGGGTPIIQETLRYQLPKAFQRYRDSLFFVTTGANHPAPDRHVISAGTSLSENEWTYPDSASFIATEQCLDNNTSQHPLYVEGAISLLEVSPTRYKTPVTEVKFEHVTGPTCRELTPKGHPPYSW